MKYLSMTNVFEGSNLNYGEGIGNILSLKKISSKGKNYSYISRQALRYDIVRIMIENLGIIETPVDKKGGVVQFSTDTKIDEYPEIDLFGYMKTTEGQKIRKAIVRLTDAISLEPFYNDIDFANNMGLAKRNKDITGNDLFQSEIHQSYYSYTVTIDLDEIGKDSNYDIEISKKEKTERVNNLLKTIKLLYRDIRGKRENLSPVFSIGGIYDSGNPFFYNRVSLDFTESKILIDTEKLNSVLNICSFDDKPIKEKTKIGYIKGIFDNIDEIDEVVEKKEIEEYFKELRQNINKYYGV